MHKFGMAAIRVKPFLIYTATAHNRIEVAVIALCKRCKGHWKFLPPKFDFNAEIQNFKE